MKVKLEILGMLDKKTSEKIRKRYNLNNDILFYFSGHSEFQIHIGKIFNNLTYKEQNYHIKAELIFITQSYFIASESIEVGWRNIIGLKLHNKSESILTNIKELKNWDDDWTKKIILW